MKKLMYLSVVFALVATLSCKKSSDTSSSGNNLQLSATKVTKIKRKEPVLFSVNNTTNTIVVWKVVPPAGVWYSHAGDKAYIRFNKAGTYKVYASAGNYFDSTIITIDSTIYIGDTTLPGTTLPIDSTVYHNPNDSTKYPVDTTRHDSTIVSYDTTTISLFGDQLYITPQVILDSSIVNNAYLFLTTSTGKTYPNANPQLLDTVSTNNNNVNSITGISILYNGLFLPGGVSSSSSSIASKTNYFTTLTLNNGTYTFNITFNGTVYTGSFTKSGTTFTFTWPYTSGVIISPLTVSK